VNDDEQYTIKVILNNLEGFESLDHAQLKYKCQWMQIYLQELISLVPQSSDTPQRRTP